MRDCGNLVAAVRLYFVDHQHRRRRMSLLEILAHVFGQDGWSERTKRLSLLYSLVENILHAGSSRISKNRTIAQGPGPKLHSSLEPTNHKSIGEVARRLFG